jgi:hypothetical protein
VIGTFPPGKLGRLRRCGVHLLNMLKAHAAAYKVIKAEPGAVLCMVMRLGI